MTGSSTPPLVSAVRAGLAMSMDDSNYLFLEEAPRLRRQAAA